MQCRKVVFKFVAWGGNVKIISTGTNPCWRRNEDVNNFLMGNFVSVWLCVSVCFCLTLSLCFCLSVSLFVFDFESWVWMNLRQYSGCFYQLLVSGQMVWECQLVTVAWIQIGFLGSHHGVAVKRLQFTVCCWRKRGSYFVKFNFKLLSQKGTAG